MENILNNDNYICVAVSKTKPIEEINKVYNLGHRDFGENKVQELIKKQKELPKDINWHMIGHLQTNKVKVILPVSYLIHSVDSIKLLNVIDKESKKINSKKEAVKNMPNLLFLKGKTYSNELYNIPKNLNIKFQTFPSITSAESRILLYNKDIL